MARGFAGGATQVSLGAPRTLRRLCRADESPEALLLKLTSFMRPLEDILERTELPGEVLGRVLALLAADGVRRSIMRERVDALYRRCCSAFATAFPLLLAWPPVHAQRVSRGPCARAAPQVTSSGRISANGSPGLRLRAALLPQSPACAPLLPPIRSCGSAEALRPLTLQP